MGLFFTFPRQAAVQHFELQPTHILVLLAALGFGAQHPHLYAAAALLLALAGHGHVKFNKGAGRPPVRGNPELVVSGYACPVHALGNGRKRAGNKFLKVHGYIVPPTTPLCHPELGSGSLGREMPKQVRHMTIHLTRTPPSARL